MSYTPGVTRRLLLFGSRGLLGTDLLKELSARDRYDILAPSRVELDISNSGMLLKFLEDAHPDCIINSAGFTDVEASERHFSSALELNVSPVRDLVSYCNNRGSSLFHFSTDYVFPGSLSSPLTVNDEPNPMNAYGLTKLMAEQVIIENIHSDFTIVRTSWLFGKSKKNFVSSMCNRAVQGLETRVVNDQIGSPTSTTDLAARIGSLVSKNVGLGITHLSGVGEASWYEVAQFVFNYFGVPELVYPIKTSELNLQARRPSYSYLENSDLGVLGIEPMPDWEISLSTYLKDFNKAENSL